MTRARVLLVALVALSACGPQTGEKAESPTPGVIEPFDVHVEAARYGVMLDQVGNLTAELPSPADPSPSEPTYIARELREAVWQHNLARSRLCARGLYPEVSCGAPYEPVWISDAAGAAPSLEELKQRADAVGAEVTPFWSAVCDDMRERATTDEERAYVCAVE